MASSQAMTDIAHLLRPGHLQQLANILDDPDASDNDRFVALQLLKNANVAAGRILPGCQASAVRTPPPPPPPPTPPLTPPWRCCACQDTGTAIVMGKRGHHVWTDGSDEACLARGVYDTYTATNLRYSQARSRRQRPLRPPFTTPLCCNFAPGRYVAGGADRHQIVTCICLNSTLTYDVGMEAVWKIEVEDFPAFVVVDDKGNDFFDKWSH